MALQLISLLQAISQDRSDLRLASFGEAEIRWALANGLGALLVHATKTDSQAPASPSWPLLRGADLTARVLTMEHVDAMVEIIDGCESQMAPLALLKGISICGQHYPAPHLRAMRDIDFLIDSSDLVQINALLIKLGYRQRYRRFKTFYQNHHHDMPWYHPQKGVWIEVHRALFSSQNRVSHDKLFGLENVKAQLQPSEFQGRSVNRLSNELQIAYVASHWASDFNVVGGMVAFLDLICLLKNCGQQVNWQRILSWVDGSIAATHLYLLLSYMAKHQIVYVAPSVLDALRCKQRALRNLNLTIVHGLIDRYLVAGKEFGPILSERNLKILWNTLVSSGVESRNLFLVPPYLLMPKRFRTKLQF